MNRARLINAVERLLQSIETEKKLHALQREIWESIDAELSDYGMPGQIDFGEFRFRWQPAAGLGMAYSYSNGSDSAEWTPDEE